MILEQCGVNNMIHGNTSFGNPYYRHAMNSLHVYKRQIQK